MRRLMIALLALLSWTVVAAQETAQYKDVENPYQADFEFVPGRPVDLHVAITGVQFESLAVVPQTAAAEGNAVDCDFELDGTSVAEKKFKVTTVVLFEGSDGRGIQRTSLEPFKVKPGKPFFEKQTLSVPGDALTGAKKVYIFIQLD